MNNQLPPVILDKIFQLLSLSPYDPSSLESPLIDEIYNLWYGYCNNDGFYLVSRVGSTGFLPDITAVGSLVIHYPDVDANYPLYVVLGNSFLQIYKNSVSSPNLLFSLGSTYSIRYDDENFVYYLHDDEAYFGKVEFQGYRLTYSIDYSLLSIPDNRWFKVVNLDFPFKLKTRFFDDDNSFKDDITSGIALAVFCRIIQPTYNGRLFTKYNYETNLVIEPSSGHTISTDLKSYDYQTCEYDFINVYFSFSSDKKSSVISKDFSFNDFPPVSFPNSIVCQFYIDCDDCDEINHYFKMIFKAVNSMKGDDMDYTDVLTQIAQNLSIMSNDVNTNLDNINTNITNINDKLQTTEIIDNSQKSITDVLNQQANTIQVDEIGLLRSKKGYY